MSGTTLSILHLLFQLIFKRTLWHSAYYYSIDQIYIWERFRDVNKPKVTQLVGKKAEIQTLTIHL